MLGAIFKKARQDIQNPATLRRLIAELIDTENWSSIGADIKGDIYEGLPAKSAACERQGASRLAPCRSQSTKNRQLNSLQHVKMVAEFQVSQ